MAALISLLRGQWFAYWRRYARAGRAGAASLVVLTLLFGFAASKFVPLLRASARELESGGTARFTRALAWVFIAWLASLWEDARLGIKPRALLRLPIRPTSLALFTLFSLLIPPTSWLAVALSLSIFYPPLAAHSPPAALLATLAFIVASAAASFALVNLTRAASRRVTFILALATGALIALALRPHAAGSDSAARRLTFVVAPARLVADAAAGQSPWRGALFVCVAAAASCLLAAWSFRIGLRAEPSASRRASVFGRVVLPGRIGGLVKKDFRYFNRMLDPYLGWLVAAAYCLSLFNADAAEPKSLLIVTLLMFVPSASLAFNCFGLDAQAGLDRYALLPLPARLLLCEKNLAYALTAGAQSVLVVCAATLKFGVAVGWIGVVCALSLALCYLACGNVLSVVRPFRMTPHRFSSGGEVSDFLIGLTLANLPTLALGFTLYGATAPTAALRAILLLAVSAALYFAALRWAARRLGMNWENLRESLS